MSVGVIIFIVALSAFFVFEVVSLVITVIKRSKDRKKKAHEANAEIENINKEINNNKEVDAQ